MNWVQPFMFLTICTLQLYNAHKHECLINVKRLKRGIAFFDTFTHLKICEHLMHEICASKVCYVKCVCASYRLPQRHTMVTQLWHLLIICAFTYFMFYLKLQLLWIKRKYSVGFKSRFCLWKFKQGINRDGLHILTRKLLKHAKHTCEFN